MQSIDGQAGSAVVVTLSVLGGRQPRSLWFCRVAAAVVLCQSQTKQVLIHLHPKCMLPGHFWMACMHRMMSITASAVLGKCIDRWSRILFTLTPFVVACHWKRTAATRWFSRQGQRQEIDLQALWDGTHLTGQAHPQDVSLLMMIH